MNKLNKFLLLSLIGLAVAGVTTIAAIHNQGQGDTQAQRPYKTQKMIEFENKFPQADYDEPEPTDEKERAKRRAKGRKYDKDMSGIAVEPETEVATSTTDWLMELWGLPAIPVKQSDLIIIGNVTNAQAHLSANKLKVYSEFTVNVEAVLKNDKDKSIQVGEAIDVDRIGGRVKFPSGKVGLFFASELGMPQVGGRYMLFLTQTDKESGFSIFTGYELRNGRVILLDRFIGASEKYQGTNEETLLTDVRAAIAKPQQRN